MSAPRSAGAAGSSPHHGNADQAELGKFDDLAHQFWDPYGEFRPLHVLNPVRARFVAERAPVSGARVLDVGCGGGLLAESLTRAGAQVTAIDLAPSMIEVARLHAAEQGLKIDYQIADAAVLADQRPGEFDIVTSMEMLEHVPDPAHMTATLARLVKPGGHVFFSTINRNLKSFLLTIVAAEYIVGIIPRGTHEYERLIRPAELAAWGRAAGLSLREVAGLDFNPLDNTCRLSDDPSLNYLVHLERTRGAVVS